MATPEIANLGVFVIGLVAAGAMAAALSTGGGLMISISSSFAHDIYYRIINPQASEQKRLLIGRISIVVATLLVGYYCIKPTWCHYSNCCMGIRACNRYLLPKDSF